MGRRRFTSLILLVALGALVLIARLFTVQIAEHDVWTAQADALMREGSVEPYTRGEILDCRGRVLARDVESYRINADYRDFRRGNALGIVAHARSTLEMRSVPLASARETLVPWAIALGRLAPRDIEGFQRGEALAFEGFQITAAAAESDARFGRGVDLEFYATALFDLKASERSRLKKLEGKEPELAFVDRIARVRGISREETERALARRCELDLSYLDDLAQLWVQAQPGTEAPIARVQAELERWRADVEDGAAGDLFESAAGFPAGRLESACLEEFFDLDWIRRTMRWDAARLQAWTRAARSDWLALRDGPLLDFAVERVRRDSSGLSLADLVLNEVSPLFVARKRERGSVSAGVATWCGSRSAVVLGELGKLFDFDLPDQIDEPPQLPFFDASFVERAEATPADAGVLAEAEFWRADGGSPEPALLESAAANWRALSAEASLDRASLRRGFEALFLRFEDAFQSELRARLQRIREYAETPGAKLPMAKAGLGRAEERARYILKDRGSRHFVAVARPSYPLVNLLTRYPEHLRGFEVERVHLRVNPTRDAADRPIARLLVGGLSQPSVARRISQVETERRIAELEGNGARDEATEAMLAELRAGLDRPDEEIGNSGLERWFEP
ncbi:MAG TPA: hypothetical protein VK843_16320, partial [Planctomycetota bacterium]|nr:hypothetical protein [Planctomycetota bacterium]